MPSLLSAERGFLLLAQRRAGARPRRLVVWVKRRRQEPAMFVGITNSPRDYAWGSTTAIAGLLGRAASGQPEAELWLGAHHGSPSVIVDPGSVGGAADLAEWIAASPEVALGPVLAGAPGEPRLPFLMKILAAQGPLSLQAHPSPERAAAPA